MGHHSRRKSVLRAFLGGEATSGLVLMVSAALALVIANSPLASRYFATLKYHLGPLSLLHWINDGLMAAFFLVVGLEIKRELRDGRLRTWPERILPGFAALGGMIAPALVYTAINWRSPDTLGGWAIPVATDIAFALGVLALLGRRVPISLKVFLTALAILDDLGAVRTLGKAWARKGCCQRVSLASPFDSRIEGRRLPLRRQHGCSCSRGRGGPSS
jgi:NhaA family Na+:H+ antiporter